MNLLCGVSGIVAALNGYWHLAFWLMISGAGFDFFDGMVALAVPVFDAKGRFSAALAFHGPTTRLSIVQSIAKKDILIEAAQKLGEITFGQEEL